MARREKMTIGELTVRKLNVDRGDGLSKVDVMKCIGGDIEYDVADPYTVSLGIAPAGSKLVEIIADIEAAFNSDLTNVLVVGNATNDDAYAAAGDIDETSATLQRVAGRRAEFAVDTEIFAKYTYTVTTTGPTAGKAHITMVLA